MKHTILQRRGQLTLQVLLFGALAMILLTGFVLWVDVNLKAAYRAYNKALAFTIAEAGIEYYRWHLAHDNDDYWDGNGSSTPGPYIHDYYDKDGNLLGEFALEITPPPSGSTVVRVRAAGKVEADSSVEKIVEVRMAIPSLARFAVVANATMRFGVGTETFGPIHSNGGIRFDGLAHNVISSAVSAYDDPDHSGGNEFGVHTHVAPTDPLPPAAVPSRTDVFEAGREFPSPNADFAGITQDLSQIRTDAIAGGFYRPSSTAYGSPNGYEIVLLPNDTFQLSVVTQLVPPPSNCTNYLTQSGWGTWSIASSAVLGVYPLPANNLIFIEDNIWVRGQIDTARLTIASGRIPDNPATRTNIIFNQDALYTNYDGQDVLSYIAQNTVNVGMVSNDTIRIDGAVIPQNGRVGRYYYRPPGSGQNRCSPYHVRSALTSYGMIGTNQRYGFAYTDGTGYQARNLIYDSNLLYAPPPSFPLTADTYDQISWEEIR